MPNPTPADTPAILPASPTDPPTDTPVTTTDPAAGPGGDPPARAVTPTAWTATIAFEAMIDHQLVRFRRGQSITGDTGAYLASAGAPLTPVS